MKNWRKLVQKPAERRAQHLRYSLAIVLTGLWVGIFLPSPVFSSQETDLENLKKLALEKKSYEERAWRKLLLIPDSWLGGSKSLVDDRQFFLAKDGKSNPKAELLATLEAYFLPDVPPEKPEDESTHAQCRFPARMSWVKKELGFDAFPLVNCKKRDDFLRYLQYDRVSLVFSSYFLNSPASMFGHTFFRLHRPRPAYMVSDEGLLDDILNFSAVVPEVGAVNYALLGLMGGFQGRFSLVPYYNKIQEYSNSESRDLWEFELDLTQAQVDHLKELIWELGPIYIRYFYLDENCSYILLSLLEAADPTLKLTGNFYLYAIPADTLRAVTSLKNRVRKIKYRPSNLAKFKSRVKQLDSKEADIFQELVSIERENIPDTLYADCGSECRAKVTDTALDFIDYEERLYGWEEPKTYPKLRRALLASRSQLAVKPLPIAERSDRDRPDFAHNSTRIGLKSGVQPHTSFVTFHWRPALHDIRSRPTGYSNEMEIDFMETWIKYETATRSLYLERLNFIEVMSLSRNVTGTANPNWHLGLGYDTYPLCAGGKERCNRFYFHAGLGKALHFSDKAFAFALLHADLGFSNEPGQTFHIGPYVLGGVLVELTDWLKFTSTLGYAKHFAARTVDRLKHETTLSFYPSPTFEARLFFEGAMAGQNRVLNRTGAMVFVYF